jgi:hypothetical protein
LAIIEFGLHTSNVWGQLVNAHAFDRAANDQSSLRAFSTFGHPLVAGAALAVLALVVLTQILQ